MTHNQLLKTLEKLSDTNKLSNRALVTIYNAYVRYDKYAPKHIYTVDEYLDKVVPRMTPEEAFEMAQFGNFCNSDNYCQYNRTGWIVSYPAPRNIPHFMDELVDLIITETDGDTVQIESILSDFIA